MRYRIVFIKNGLKKLPENYHQKTINHLTKGDYENNNTRQNIKAYEKNWIFDINEYLKKGTEKKTKR